MGRVDATKEYYHLTLPASPDGKLVWATFSHFAGYADEQRKDELRADSLVDGRWLSDLYQQLSERCVVVNNDQALHAFLTRPLVSLVCRCGRRRADHLQYGK